MSLQTAVPNKAAYYSKVDRARVIELRPGGGPAAD